MIHAGHLGGLAADQCAAGLPAAISNASNDIAGGRNVQLAGCIVIEKEQGFSTLYNKVVDRHRNQVDAHAAMDAGIDCEFQLGADTIIGRDQHRIAVAAGLEIKQATEATEGGVSTLAAGRFGKWLDGVHEGVASGNIHARIRIGKAVWKCLFATVHAASLPHNS